jgi:hypothetical protein
MNIDMAKQILAKSIINLEQRRGKGTIIVSDVEAEVINNACLYILKRQKEGKSFDSMFIAQTFTNAACSIIPQYQEQHAMIALMGIQQNVAWEGMWNYLRDYFRKNHGIQIDSITVAPKVFYSTSHERYENGILVNDGPADRTINLSFANANKELMVSIEPTLSPKSSVLFKQEEKKFIYIGTDPDYKFMVLFDAFDEIEKFILELPNRKIRIEYFG